LQRPSRAQDAHRPPWPRLHLPLHLAVGLDALILALELGPAAAGRPLLLLQLLHVLRPLMFQPLLRGRPLALPTLVPLLLLGRGIPVTRFTTRHRAVGSALWLSTSSSSSSGFFGRELCL
jgi:hypothetical protein